MANPMTVATTPRSPGSASRAGVDGLEFCNATKDGTPIGGPHPAVSTFLASRFCRMERSTLRTGFTNRLPVDIAVERRVHRAGWQDAWKRERLENRAGRRSSSHVCRWRREFSRRSVSAGNLYRQLFPQRQIRCAKEVRHRQRSPERRMIILQALVRGAALRGEAHQQPRRCIERNHRKAAHRYRVDGYSSPFRVALDVAILEEIERSNTMDECCTLASGVARPSAAPITVRGSRGPFSMCCIMMTIFERSRITDILVEFDDDRRMVRSVAGRRSYRRRRLVRRASPLGAPRLGRSSHSAVCAVGAAHIGTGVLLAHEDVIAAVVGGFAVASHSQPAPA